MASITVTPLEEGLPFGARINGVTYETLADEAVRKQIYDTFIDRGMIVFEGVEPTAKMQAAISVVIGPLKDHPVKMVERMDEDSFPGVITIRNDPDGDVVEIDGERLATWQPWHFDHSYNDELNRAGVLRAATIATKGGRTGFADGIQIYNDLKPETRDALDGLEVIYNLDLRYSQQFFGLPKNFKEIVPKTEELLKYAAAIPRAIHPAVWQRETGEKVVHFSAYGTRGIAGDETPEGNAKLSALWDEVEETLKPYYHSWKPTDMLVWDNWRMLHMACGCDPEIPRIVHRSTIKGDYGLGRWETPVEEKVSADAMM